MAWENLSETEKGYIAGFFDGEGCITFCSNNTQTEWSYPKIAFYNTNKEVIDWIAKCLDGKSLRRTIDKRRDKIHTKNNYAVVIGKTQDVFLFIKQIYPYLKVKKKRAELLLKYFDWFFKRENYKHSPEDIIELNKYKTLMSKLNRRGEED
jgi:hypothetical protein